MKRVLLVDDDPLILKIFQDGLARHDFQVTTASDGLEAMKALRTAKPDVVVLDLMMPKLTGVDVLKFIRGDKELSALPVVVLSNSYLDDLAQGARAAGVQEALLKSRCTPAILVEVIGQLLGGGPPAAPAGETAKEDRPSPGTPGASGAAQATEAQIRERAHQGFLDHAGETCAALRGLFEAFEKAPEETQRGLRLEALYRKVHFVTATAGLTGCHRLAKMSSVLEALLFVLMDKPARINPQVIRTIATGLDFIESLFQQSARLGGEPLLNPQILVVDDDPVSNRLEVVALRRAQLHAYGAEDPLAALQRLEASHYDLILLDIEMPGLDGFEFCRRTRLLPHYRQTPIIFVTSHTDPETRAEALLCGGNDVITKPIFPMELAVKAVTHLLKTEIGE